MTENDDCFIICVQLFSAINDLITLKLNAGYVFDQLFINFNINIRVKFPERAEEY